MPAWLQGIADLVERVASALSGVRVELGRVTRLVSLRLHVRTTNATNGHRDCVVVELVADNYHDIMTATLQVCRSPVCMRPTMGLKWADRCCDKNSRSAVYIWW